MKRKVYGSKKRLGAKIYLFQNIWQDYSAKFCNSYPQAKVKESKSQKKELVKVLKWYAKKHCLKYGLLVKKSSMKISKKDYMLMMWK